MQACASQPALPVPALTPPFGRSSPHLPRRHPQPRTAAMQATPSGEHPLQAPLSPLHELGGNLHELADVASLQAGDALQDIVSGRLAEASSRLQDFSDHALRSMLEELSAGRLPPGAVLGSLGGYPEGLLQVQACSAHGLAAAVQTRTCCCLVSVRMPRQWNAGLCWC